MPTVKELHVKQTSSGVKHTTKLINEQNEAMGRSNAMQDKHEKGASSMGKNSTANFAKMSQGLGGLVHVYATVAANVFALSSAFLVLSNNMNVDIMIKSAEDLSASTGISYAGVAKSMKDVTHGALSMQEALRSASIGVSSGLSGKQLTEIADIATKAANALGRSVPDAINRMTQAVVKNEPELVDEFGIILRVDEATKDYAQTLGKTKAELTSFDRQMAIHAQLVKQGTEKFGNVESQVNAYNKLGAAFAEMTHNVVSFINLGLAPLVNMFSENILLLGTISAIFAKGIFAKAIPEVANLTESLQHQRNVLQESIATKTQKLGEIGFVQKAQAIEVDLKPLKKPQLQKIQRDLLKAIPLKELEGMFGTEFAAKASKGLLSSRTIAREMAGGNLEQLDNTLKGINDNNIADKKRLNTLKLQNTQLHELVQTTKILNGDIKQSTLDSVKDLNTRKAILLNAEKLTLERQKQALYAKDLRTGAFSVGIQGGFTGGGFTEAEKSIKNSTTQLTAFQKVGVRTAGVLGNIAGFAGRVLSFLSGWGIAAAIFGSLLGPIGDALSLSSKKARESTEAFNESSKALNKMQEDAEKIQSGDRDNLADSVNRATAAANNYQGQLEQVYTQFEALGGLANRTALDKVLSFDFDSLNTKIRETTENVEKLYRQIGEVPPLTLKADIEAITKASSEVDKLEQQLRDAEEKKKSLLEFKESAFTFDLFGMADADSITRTMAEMYAIQTKLTAEKEKESKLQDKVTEDLKKANDLLRERETFLKEIQTATKDISKRRIAETDKLLKSADFYKDQKDFGKLLDGYNKQLAIIADNESKVAIAKKNNLRVSEELYKNLENSAKDLANIEENMATLGLDSIDALKERVALYKRLNTNQAENAVNIMHINNQIKQASDDINRGDISAISTKYSLERKLIDLKIAHLKVQNQLTLATMQKAYADEDIANFAKLALNYAAAQMKIEGLEVTLNTTLSKGNEIYDKRTKELDRQLSILKSQQSVIDTQLSRASKDAKGGTVSDVSIEFDLKRKAELEKIKVLQGEISRLQLDTSKNTGNAVKNAAAAVAIREKIITIEQTINRELSEQQKLNAENLRLNELNTLEIDKQSDKINTQIKIAESLTRDPDSTKAETMAAKLRVSILKTTLKYKNDQVSINKKIEKQQILINKIAIDGLDKEKAKLVLSKLQNEQLILEANNRADIIEQQREQHELAKQQTDAATIFEDPKGFTDLLGKEFAILSKEFSDSIMNPVDKAADSMLRIMDTATDTLYDAIAAGENVGVAMKDALIKVTDDIARELSTDIMKQWNRDLMKYLFNIESDEAKKLRAAEETARNTAKMAGVVPESEKPKDESSLIDKLKSFFGIESEKTKAEIAKAETTRTAENKTNTDNIISTDDTRNDALLASLDRILEELVTQTSKMCACTQPSIEDDKSLSIEGFKGIGTDLSEPVPSIEDKAVELAKPVASPEDVDRTTSIIKTTSDAALTAADTAFLKSTAIDREQSNIFNAHKTAADYRNQIGDLSYDELQNIRRNTTPVADAGSMVGDVNSFDVLNSMGDEQVGLQTDMVSNIMSGNGLLEDSTFSATQDSINLASSMHADNLGIISSLDSLSSSGIGGTIGSMVGGKYGGLIGGFLDLAISAFANGGITNSLNRYATGGVTDGTEVAMIGDNASGKEAIVPLPDGETIPVEFTGDSQGGDTVINTTINITGVETNNAEAVRRSAGQVALSASQALNRSQRRNG